MEKAKLILDFVDKLIWPIVIMTIVLIFRKHIVKRFQDIKNVKGAGFEIKFEKKIEAIVDASIENKMKQANIPDKFEKNNISIR